jgi:hypothetical protein
MSPSEMRGPLAMIALASMTPEPTVPAEVVAALELFQRIVGRSSAHVLGAADVEELRWRIDEVLDRPDYRQDRRRLGAAFITIANAGLAPDADEDGFASVEKRLRPEAAALVADAWAACAALWAAIEQLPEIAGVDATALGAADRAAPDYVTTAPREIAEALLAADRGTVASFALFAALEDESPVVPDHEITLAALWRDGCWAALRVAAAFGAPVPEGVLPAVDRIDVEGMVRTYEARRARIDAEFAGARDQGTPYLPRDSILDD